jgi:hypothetical protein
VKGWSLLALLALIILHQDFWLWGDRSLVGGFLPVGLAYHAVISLLATALWFAVAWGSWPEDPESDEASAAEAAGEGDP